MDRPTSDIQRGAIRVSDAERDHAVAELSEHYQAGRLTLEEFDDRSGLALRARTGNDLGALFGDLPTAVVPAARTPVSTVGTVIPGDMGGLLIPGDTGGRRAGGPLVARAVIACVIAAILLGNVAGGLGHLGHHRLGWLVPVAVLGFVFLRLSRHR
jgi:hypothetical protein